MCAPCEELNGNLVKHEICVAVDPILNQPAGLGTPIGVTDLILNTHDMLLVTFWVRL
jgi:hypothetical protein